MRYGRLRLREIVVFQIFEDVISRKLERVYKRSSRNFLKVKLDRNKSRESFDALQRGSSECTKYPDGGSSLHFVEDFEVVRQWSFVIKPQLKAVHGYREHVASIEKAFLKRVDTLRRIS